MGTYYTQNTIIQCPERDVFIQNGSKTHLIVPIGTQKVTTMTIAAIIAAFGAAKIGTVLFSGVMVANGYALYHYFTKSKTPPAPPVTK